MPERASQKQEILRTFNAVLRQNKEKRFGSGLHRQHQYGSSAATTGNSANVELAATVRASKVGRALVSQCTHFSSGGFNESSRGFVFVENKIYAARGMTYYTNLLSRSHNQLLLGDSPCLFSERWR